MSFLSKLFGGSKAAPAAPVAGPTLEHQGFTIRATPFEVAGGVQLCGVVEKEIDGVKRAHRFVRADTFLSVEDAAPFILTKGRQLIDERGEALFE